MTIQKSRNDKPIAIISIINPVSLHAKKATFRATILTAKSQWKNSRKLTPIFDNIEAHDATPNMSNSFLHGVHTISF